MELEELKRRLAQYLRNTGASTAEMADASQVSERTMRRYLDPDDPSRIDALALINLSERYNFEIGPAIWPERYPGMSKVRTWSANSWVRDMLRNHVALLLVNKSMDVVFCTELFARLYEKSANELNGTNMFDLDYAVTEYPWYPVDIDPRQSIVTTLISLADEGRPASEVCFFVSPHGKINRVLMQCNKVDPDHYLFVDVNMGGILSLGMEIEAEELSHRILETTYPIRYLEIIHQYMAGYPLSQIASVTGIDRDTVAEYLYNWSRVFKAKDMDELRESLWNFCAEERAIDKYNIVRCNGAVLG